MPRNLIICCDGTGNIWGNEDDTNVVKLTRTLVNDDQQILYYDPGVGTSNIYPSIGWWNRRKADLSKLVGLAYGGGVYENIGEAYGFLVEHYQRGDRIYVFGFSRGAFTARCVAGMVNLFGIVRRGTETMIPTLTRIYFQPSKVKGRADKTREESADDIRRVFTLDGRDARVYFVGVWDTVSTVGGLPFSKQNITSSATISGKNFDHVRHAVAAGEYRYGYAPRLYTRQVGEERKVLNFDDDQKSLKQLWFAGAHSDVGGSYREDGLSNCSLKWMLEEAIAKGLQCDAAKVSAINSNPLGLAHDQAFMQPLWALAGLHTRLIPRDAARHASLESRRASAKPPQTIWRPFWKNTSALLWVAAMVFLLLTIFALDKEACLFNYYVKFDWTRLSTSVSGGEMDDVFHIIDSNWMAIRYYVDFLFIGVYTMAICWLLVYARRTLAERSVNATVHHIALWWGLVPLWTLIVSDVLENVLTLALLPDTPPAPASHAWLSWLLASLTVIKLVSLLAIAGFFAWVVVFGMMVEKRSDVTV